MKTIIAGSRTFSNWDLIEIWVPVMNPTQIVSGGAKGADIMGERWARINNIPIRQFLPDWNNLGRKAGILRNEDMGRYADQAIVFWDGQSAGSRHMIEFMYKLNKNVKVIRF